MSDPEFSTVSDLRQLIDSAWADLEAFLAGLTEEQSSLQDDQGWTVTDHLTHLAVWEDSADILFRGKPRHQALGVDESYYAHASFDQINERIRQRKGRLTTSQASEELRQVHQRLMASLDDVRDADLGKTVRDFFPKAPRTDDRQVIDFIYANTAHHFTEHLGWMKTLISRAA